MSLHSFSSSFPFRLCLRLIATAALAVGALSCSSDSGGGDGPGGPGGNNPIAVSGYVFKGAVNGASVRVHAINANGDAGGVIAGPFTSDATGRWSGEVPAGTNGLHMLSANGGTYTDESTRQPVTVTSEMYGVIDVGGGNTGNVTPITHAIIVNAQYRVQLGASVNGAIDGAVAEVADAFGFDPTTTAPNPDAAAVGGSPPIDIYNAILAGFSHLIATNPVIANAFNNAETWDIVIAVAEDLTDGVLDGTTIFGDGILVDNGGTFLPFPEVDADDIGELIDAAIDWAQTNYPGLSIPNIDLSDFGNPIVTPGGDYEVSGQLAISGGDTDIFTGSFRPDTVQESIGANKIDGFTFFDGNLTVSIGFDETTPAGTMNTVSASSPENIWLSMGTIPVPGASISLNAPFTVRFQNTELVRIGSEKTIRLEGTLTVTEK